MPDSRKDRPASRQEGFTLLELLISLTITAVIVTIVFGGFRVGVRAWEKGESDTEFQDRYRNVLGLLRRQIISIYIPTETENADASEELLYFIGEENSLSFVSHRSLFPSNHVAGVTGRSEIVFVRYRVSDDSAGEGGQRLSVYEENAGFFPENGLPNPAVAEDDFYELIAGAGEVRFEYLKVEKVDAETGVPQWFWQSSWNLDDEKTFPRAVRITFRAEPESPPVYVIVPVEKNAIS